MKPATVAAGPAIAVLCGLLLQGRPAAQATGAAGQPSGNSCLTAAQLHTNEIFNSRDRPTSRDDEMPFMDPDYFLGTWNFEWDLRDSPLGPGGEWEGTVTFKNVARCSYEGDLRGTDGEGKPFTRSIRLTFDPSTKHMQWLETDSHGFELDKSGPVGGDLGGIFVHHWEGTPPVTVGGHKVRLKGTTELSSPAAHRSDVQISIDDGPFGRFGRELFTKQVAGSSERP
jgi:hypothetical protein